MNRRVAIARTVALLSFATFPPQVAGAAGDNRAFAQTSAAGVTPGTYSGRWSDGRELNERIRVISQDLITMQREDYATQPVPFHRVSPGVFRNSSGGTLTVLGPARLRWSSGSGGQSVTYSLR